MTNTELIETLKEHYPRNVRKQLVKSILDTEKQEEDATLTQAYKTINQIFSYVLQESGWEMGENSNMWDTNPLTVMSKVFPQLESTKWYKENHLTIKQDIDIMTNPTQ